MEAWIPITIAAAFMQNLRSALQRHLKGRLDTSGATMARFAYAFPFAIAYVVGLAWIGGFAWPAPTWTFAFWAVLGAVSQICATALLVALFSLRNFAAGTAYSKTETIQTAVFGIIILGDPLTAGATLAILISLVGVVAITIARSNAEVASLVASLADRAAWIGIASGALFGLSGIAYRGAALALDGGEVVMRAAFTLACVLVLQTIVMGLYMRLRVPGELTRLLRAWKLAVWVGITGMIGSVGWFTAMTLQNVAYVRAVGQVELVFTFIASIVFFRERTNPGEVIGILLIVGGILLLLSG